MAGNQLGKTYAGAAEMAYHLTGLYPAWWRGRRFDRPILAWAGGVNNEHTRNNLQRLLFGKNLGEELGTGMIPGDCIEHYSMSRGMADFVDQAFVRHVSGGLSQLALKSYEQGFRKWEGATVDVVWCDEEAPKDVYVSAQARTTASGGMVYTTFTPLLGMTEIVGWFFPQPNAPHRGLVRMTIEDAEHIPPERVAEEVAKYPEHEREARVKGIPALGSGRVFPVAESAITVAPFEIPPHWPRIAGMDFGWDHPTAVAWLAWDRDADALTLYAEHRLKEAVPAVHADAIRARGAWIPMAWPHDGMIHDKGSGVPLMEQYRAKGVSLLPQHASFVRSAKKGPEKTHPEAGCHEMLTMMMEGRFRVFRSCTMWLEEFRIYHRLDGKIVAKRDDLICASRYATTMRQYARVELPPKRPTAPPGSYDPLEVLQ